jgi:hypothetical protein
MGARMIASFAPYMTAQRLEGFQQDLGYITGAVRDGRTATARLIATAPSSGKGAPDLSGFTGFARKWSDEIEPDMTSLISEIQANRGNYEAVAALPSFRLFPWFFVIPGVILLALLVVGSLGLAGWSTLRWVVALLGVGLVVAPFAFQMFARAPKGATMVGTFRTIETRARVERIQNYFSEIAVGQGAVQLELIPALARAGLSSAEIRSAYPGLTTLDSEWIHILNDMTPMIGVMSDNVDNYEAVAALPSFRLFPWFFVIPGVILIVLAWITAPLLPPRARRQDGPKLSSQHLHQGVT